MSEPSPKYAFGSDQKISIEDLVPMTPLIRLSRDPIEFDALKNNIKTKGQKIPIKCRPHPDSQLRILGKLELLDGMGRLEILNELGTHEIRGDVEDLTDEEAYEMAFTINVNRENLTDLSIARWLRWMQKKWGYTQTKLGEIAGRGQPWISRHLAMLELIPKATPGQTGFSYEAEPESDKPRTEFQSRILSTLSPELRASVILDGMPSGREMQRTASATATVEEVLKKYASPTVSNDFLAYMLQEEAGLTLTEAKKAVMEYILPKRSTKGRKYKPDVPSVWSKLATYYPTEIIDAVSGLTPSENFETLIKYCRSYSQRLYQHATEGIRQAVMDDFT